MKVFLTGATGYIGSAVADALIKRGHVVFGLARSEDASAKLIAAGVSPVHGDLDDLLSISNAAVLADAVIHTATTNRPGAPEADRNAVEAILSALKGSSHPFIYTSGIWVTGNTGDSVADESTPLNPTPLVAWRPAVEQLVLSAAADGIRTIVIRPAVVYGRGKGMMLQFTRTAEERGAARFVGDGQNRWPLVHVDDLGELYANALERAEPGTLWFAASGPSIRVMEIAEHASRASGADGRTVAWPVDEARKELGPYADALVLDQQISSARAMRELGWTPVAPGLLDDLDSGSYAKGAATGS